jgi:hypothetical protein
MLSDELKTKWNLLIKTPNNVYNVGTERNKWVVNPAATSTYDLFSFFKFGVALGMAYLGNDILEISLCSIVYKYLIG